MAKKNNHRRRPGMTIPLAVVAGFAGPTVRIVSTVQSSGLKAGLGEASRILCGIDPYTNDANSMKWQPWMLRFGLLPIVAGLGVHKVVGGMLGVNRMLARANIPFIRI